MYLKSSGIALPLQVRGLRPSTLEISFGLDPTRKIRTSELKTWHGESVGNMHIVV